MPYYNVRYLVRQITSGSFRYYSGNIIRFLLYYTLIPFLQKYQLTSPEI